LIYNFVFRAETSPSSWKKISPVYGVVHKVENLLPSSVYVFAVRSVNQRGISTPSLDSAPMKTSGIFTTF